MSVTVPSQQSAGTLITDTLYNEIVDAIAHVLGLKLGEDALSDLSSNTVIIPTGSVMPFAGSSAPSGWVLCDGSAVSRTTYEDLYTLIGTTYGSGDGSTTFNLPDLRGRIPGGMDNMGGVGANVITATPADSLGGTTGTEYQALTTAQLPSHGHPLQGYRYNTGGRCANSIDSSSTLWTFYLGTGNTGSGHGHNNVQPTLFMNYIIKT